MNNENYSIIFYKANDKVYPCAFDRLGCQFSTAAKTEKCCKYIIIDMQNINKISENSDVKTRFFTENVLMRIDGKNQEKQLYV